MSGIIPILIIIFIISSLSNRAKQVKTNRPGQGAQQNAARPAPARTPGVQRPYAPAQPAVTPAPVPAQPLADVEPHEARDLPDGVLDESDLARADLDEGDSRECDHGSLGGSMDITSHMGQGEAYERAQVQVKPSREEEPADATASLRSFTKLNAAQMRQAVIMAEVLKRPAERMQGRRWAAR